MKAIWSLIKLPIYIFLLFGVFSSCTNLDTEPEFSYVVEKFEPHFSFEGVNDYYMRKHLIDYFKSIALGSEFGHNFSKINKWKEPMRIFIKGDRREYLMTELDEIISELNEFSSDGFYIQTVEDSLHANYYVFFGSGSDYLINFPSSYQNIKDNLGLFEVRYDEDFQIYSGQMYVDIERAVKEEQLHILREELTQSLGLANDIPYYPNSIFFKAPSRVTEYSALDRDVIRLLYHSEIRAGMGDKSVQDILEQMLGI